MTDWADILSKHMENGCHSILLTIAAVRGSTPRETGTRMLVTMQQTFGTIGGGMLEYRAIQHATGLLQSATTTPAILKILLGPEQGQCCGGLVELLVAPLGQQDLVWMKNIVAANKHSRCAVLHTRWQGGQIQRQVFCNLDDIPANENLLRQLSRMVSSDGTPLVATTPAGADFTVIEALSTNKFHLVLFGAGHVGKAIVQTLAGYPCSIAWVDERADMFPATLPAIVEKWVTPYPARLVGETPPNSYFLVMTHSHQLDMEICAAILKRGAFGYLGLIGSKTKRNKFVKRLKFRGFSSTRISKLVCPIGVAAISGKHPNEIAISVAAQLLQHQEMRQLASRDLAVFTRVEEKRKKLTQVTAKFETSL